MKSCTFFGHFLVSYESKLLKMKHESMPVFAPASHFVTFYPPAYRKVEPNLFRLFPFFFLLFLSSAAVVNFLLGSLSVQEFSRKHYPNGKFLPRDKRTCRHMIQMRKICCNSSCYWKKKRKKGITLWHWAVIECNTNNIVTAQVEISLAMFWLPLFTGLDFITTTTCWHIFLFWQAYDPPVYLLTTSSMIVLKVVRASARFYVGECIGM